MVRTETVEVPKEVYVAIDARLTADCHDPAPPMSGPLRNGDLDALTAAQKRAIRECTCRMREIRALQPDDPDPGGGAPVELCK